VRGIPRAIASLRRGGEYLASYRREWQHFLAAIRGDGPVLCTLDEGRRAVRVLLAAAASASTGRPVRVDDAPREIASPVGGSP
jgi:predicted dehydrogenase